MAGEQKTVIEEYIKSLSKDELLQIVKALVADCERMRRELDDLQGVVR